MMSAAWAPTVIRTTGSRGPNRTEPGPACLLRSLAGHLLGPGWSLCRLAPVLGHVAASSWARSRLGTAQPLGTLIFSSDPFGGSERTGPAPTSFLGELVLPVAFSSVPRLAGLRAPVPIVLIQPTSRQVSWSRLTLPWPPLTAGWRSCQRGPPILAVCAGCPPGQTDESRINRLLVFEPPLGHRGCEGEMPRTARPLWNWRGLSPGPRRTSEVSVVFTAFFPPFRPPGRAS